MIIFKEEQINTARLLLDNLIVNGIDNCKRIVMLSQIFEAGQKETKLENDLMKENK